MIAAHREYHSRGFKRFHVTPGYDPVRNVTYLKFDYNRDQRRSCCVQVRAPGESLLAVAHRARRALRAHMDAAA